MCVSVHMHTHITPTSLASDPLACLQFFQRAKVPQTSKSLAMLFHLLEFPFLLCLYSGLSGQSFRVPQESAHLMLMASHKHLHSLRADSGGALFLSPCTASTAMTGALPRVLFSVLSILKVRAAQCLAFNICEMSV